MKLATLRNGTRDGRLVVVSHDLTRCVDASTVAPTLQRALDEWTRAASHLAALAESLEHGAVPAERFHEHDALSPLPRAYARLAVSPPVARMAGSVRNMASDVFDAPRDACVAPEPDDEFTVEAGLVALVGDTPPGIAPGEAVDAIRLVVLVADVWRGAASGGSMESGSPFASALSPVAVTPDEIAGRSGSGGEATVVLALNGKVAARAEATAGFAGLTAIAASERPLGAGSIVGTDIGSAQSPTAVTSGQTFRVEARDDRGRTVFGSIERTLMREIR